MAPNLVGVGAVAAATTAITVPFPVGYTPVANDVGFVVAESVGGQAYTVPTGWAHVGPNGSFLSPVDQGTNTRLSVLWKRFVGGEAAPGLGDSGDHNIGRMTVWSDCVTTGNPWDVLSTVVESVADATVVWPGVTTVTADCRILEIAAIASPTTVGALTNSTYTEITEHIDNNTTAGNDGMIICISGRKATAGATGLSQATLASATGAFKAMMTLALRPAPVVPSARRRPRRYNPNFRR